MTTPRVTVPPHAQEAIAFNLCSLHDFDVAFVRENERFATAVITEYVRSLSAAPAPEGGAVETLKARIAELEAQVFVPGLHRCARCGCKTVCNTLNASTGTIRADSKPQDCPNGCGPMWPVTEREAGNEMADRLEALATPAEAGERLLRPAGAKPTRCYCPPDRCDAPVIMGRQAPCLRAQPPAREDAQPVDGDWQSIAMWMGFAASVIKSGEPWTDQCQREFDEAKAAYARLSATHPAPDALRVAAEALEPFSEIAGRYLAGGMRADLEARSPSLLDLIEPRDFYRARQALAALQAEQGAKPPLSPPPPPPSRG